MLIEFKTKKEGILQKKLDRFKELKIKSFMDSLEDNEKIEYDKVYEWVKLHKKLIC